MKSSTIAVCAIALFGRGAAAARTEGWSVETLDGKPDLATVWATPDGAEVWAAGAGAAMRHRMSGAWRAEKVPSPVEWRDLDGSGAGDVWAVGGAGGMGHWDGRSWTAPPGVDDDPYEGVAAGGPATAVAINEDSVAVWDGKSWIFAAGTGRPAGLRAVAALDGKGRYLAVGEKGAAILIDGKAWKAETSKVEGALHAVASCGGGEAVAVGAAAARRDAKGKWKALAPPPVEVHGAAAACKGKKVARVAAVAGDEVLILDVAANEWTRATVSAGASLTDVAAVGKGLAVVGKSGFFATLPGW